MPSSRSSVTTSRWTAVVLRHLSAVCLQRRQDEQQDAASQRFRGLQWRVRARAVQVGHAGGLSTGTVTTDGVTVSPHFKPTRRQGCRPWDAKDASAGLTPRRLHTARVREDPEEAERRLKASRSERAQNSEAQGEESQGWLRHRTRPSGAASTSQVVLSEIRKQQPVEQRLPRPEAS
jgi:hypothetical protein